MPLVDERGRLFGTINLIDLGVLIVLGLLIPLGYGGYVLFHTPAPRLVAVVPAVVPFAKGVEQRVQVKGDHLRPFLRPKIGTNDTRSFLVESPHAGEIRFADVPVGTYDVVLFDESQEMSRLPKALTILPPPVQLVGWFSGSLVASDRLIAGLKFGPSDQLIAQIVDVDARGDANTRPATLRVNCQLTPDHRCLVAGVPVAAGVDLNLPAAAPSDRASFHVTGLRADANWVDVKVRLMGFPDALAQIRPGDVDSRTDSPTAAAPPTIEGVTSGAVVRSLGELLKSQGVFTVTASKPQPMADLTAYGVLTASVPVDAREAALLVPVEMSSADLRYRGTPIRPGHILEFETANYRLQALIVGVGKPDHP